MRAYDGVDRRVLLSAGLAICSFWALCVQRPTLRTSQVTTPELEVIREGCKTALDSKERPAQLSATQASIAAYRKLPIVFEPALQKRSDHFPFKARGHGYTFSLAADEMLLTQSSGSRKAFWPGEPSLKCIPAVDIEVQVSICMKLLGSNPAARCTSEDPRQGRMNYFIGNDPSQWRTKVPTYGRVRFEGVYP